MVTVFKNAGESSAAKTTPISLLFVVSKVFEKLVHISIADHLEKCGLFSDFQYGFRSSRSTADLLTIGSDRIARAFNRFGANRVVALNILKAVEALFLLYIHDLPDDVISDTAINADNPTDKFHQATFF